MILKTNYSSVLKMVVIKWQHTVSTKQTLSGRSKEKIAKRRRT